MRNRDMPATGSTTDVCRGTPGLTKFEATAIAAMQGIVGDTGRWKWALERQDRADPDDFDGPDCSAVASLAQLSCALATALWDEIERRTAAQDENETKG